MINREYDNSRREYDANHKDLYEGESYNYNAGSGDEELYPNSGDRDDR